LAGHDLVALFASIRGFETDPERLLNAIAVFFEADGASLFLSVPPTPGYRLAASFGSSALIPGDTIVYEGDSIGGQALVQRTPLLLGHSGDRPELTSSMVVPLLTGDRPIGLLNFSRGANHTAYDVRDLDRAEALAAVLSFLFENALLVNELATQRKRLDGIVELLGVATFVSEPNGQVTGVNESARQLIGSSEKFVDALKTMPPEMAGIAQSFDKVLRQGTTPPPQRIHVGERFFVLSVLRLEDGGVAWAFEEVTAEQKLQAELSRTQRLAEIGQMTAAIAHEIRNPLTSLIGAGKMLQKEPEMAVEFGQMVEDEARRLNDLCDEFLAFARPMRLNLEPVNLEELAARIVAAHQHDAAKNSVELTLRVDANLPIIQADRARTEQVLHNLVLNAIQACEWSGNVCLSVTAEGFRVEDTGKGIEESAMERLFTPFFTTRAKGTGLGLCNVKRIMDAHGGRIEVRRLEPGTCFDISFGGRAA
jgi:signal transduction histidine kinase